MSSQRIQKMFNYHQWAWRHVFASVHKLDEAEYRMERPFFWGSIHNVLAHSVSADYIWLNRTIGNHIYRLSDGNDYADFEEILEQWMAIWDDWSALLRSFTENEYESPIKYRTTEDIDQQTVLADILHHMINHGTEHRSQLTPLLFQLGHPTPALDYIAYCRQHD